MEVSVVENCNRGGTDQVSLTEISFHATSRDKLGTHMRRRRQKVSRRRGRRTWRLRWSALSWTPPHAGDV